MCVAILLLPGNKIGMDKLDEGARCNPDGSGYSYVDELGVVRNRKSLDWKNIRDQYEHDVEKYGGTSPFLIHHRVKSHGEINKENCHPFAMDDGGSFIHNGIISIPNIPEGESDTRWFVRHILDKLPRKWERDYVWCAMVEKMIGSGSKAVGLWPDKAYYIFNEGSGHWEDDEGKTVHGKNKEDREKHAAWFSNYSCDLRTAWSGGGNPKATAGTGGGGATKGTISPVNRDWQRPGNHTEAPKSNTSLLSSPKQAVDDSDDGWITASNGTRTWRKPDATPATVVDDHSGLTFLAKSAKDIVGKYIAKQTASDAAFSREMLDNGLCPECGIDHATPTRAVIHMVFHCHDFAKVYPELADEIAALRQRAKVRSL